MNFMRARILKTTFPSPRKSGIKTIQRVNAIRSSHRASHVMHRANVQTVHPSLAAMRATGFLRVYAGGWNLLRMWMNVVCRLQPSLAYIDRI